MGKNPIAKHVDKTQWGVFCANPYCGMPVYLDRIESGPRLGVRETYRHVNRNPPCLYRPAQLVVKP